MLLYCLWVAVATGVIAGLSPSVESLRPQLAESLKGSSGAVTRGSADPACEAAGRRAGCAQPASLLVAGRSLHVGRSGGSSPMTRASRRGRSSASRSRRSTPVSSPPPAFLPGARIPGERGPRRRHELRLDRAMVRAQSHARSRSRRQPGPASRGRFIENSARTGRLARVPPRRWISRSRAVERSRGRKPRRSRRSHSGRHLGSHGSPLLAGRIRSATTFECPASTK